MDLPGLIMISLLWIGVLFSALFAFIIADWKTNSVKGYVIILLLCSMTGALGYIIELQSKTLEGILLGVKLGYLGKAFCAPLFLLFSWSYYNMKKPYWLRHSLFILPLITVGLVSTCEYHSLYYSSIQIDENGMLVLSKTWFYYVYMAYSLLLLFLYLAGCIHKLDQVVGTAKKILRLMILSGFIPIATAIIYMLGLCHGYDPIPVGIAGTSILLCITLVRMDILDKNMIINEISTAIILVDSRGRVNYFNPAALQLFPQLASDDLKQRSEAVSNLFLPEQAYLEVAHHTYKRDIVDLYRDGKTSGKMIYFSDVTEIDELLQKDAMTGLYNHAAFYDVLQKEIERHQIEGISLTIAIVDIDDFKQVNDRYGHANGDVVLLHLASLLSKHCDGEGCTVCRYGGEEFSVIFAGAAASHASELIQNVLTELKEHRFEFASQPITFSCGLANYENPISAAAFFDLADTALYTVKRNGKAAIVSYETIPASIKERLSI